MFNKYKHKAVLVHKADGAPNSTSQDVAINTGKVWDKQDSWNTQVTPISTSLQTLRLAALSQRAEARDKQELNKFLLSKALHWD